MKKISATILAVVSGWVASGRPENSASYSVNAQQNKVELDVYAAGPAQAELLARLTAGRQLSASSLESLALGTFWQLGNPIVLASLSADEERTPLRVLR